MAGKSIDWDRMDRLLEEAADAWRKKQEYMAEHPGFLLEFLYDENEGWTWNITAIYDYDEMGEIDKVFTDGNGTYFNDNEIKCFSMYSYENTKEKRDIIYQYARNYFNEKRNYYEIWVASIDAAKSECEAKNEYEGVNK